MQFAIGPDGSKIEAARGRKGRCPVCGEPCSPKCGTVRVHHWAHIAGVECDPWWEPETDWHRSWKALFDPEVVEVPMGPHRADIATERVVVELQNSAISEEEIAAREAFYGSMIWIVNAASFADRFFLTRLMGDNVFAFRWKQIKPTWLRARRTIYLDFGFTTVADLRGARFRSTSHSFGQEGEERSYDRRTVVRYRGSSEVLTGHSAYKPDESLRDLTPWQLSRTMLRLQTLYRNGSGSAAPVDRETIFRRHGLSAVLRAKEPEP
ncbi:MAG TPA: competence protein CoiA family protein [Fimbriimonadaceae bacterium]|nr:competence protein CoiA family protein [Fimbriimonadaceae bacterium]